VVGLDMHACLWRKGVDGEEVLADLQLFYLIRFKGYIGKYFSVLDIPATC
jgi:hypothetical protein